MVYTVLAGVAVIVISVVLLMNKSYLTGFATCCSCTPSRSNMDSAYVV